MHRRRCQAGAIATVALTALAFTGASDAGAPSKQGTIKLSAQLRGQNEIPPADPEGSGTAKVKLKPDKGEACFDLRFDGIENAIMAHIHKGGADVNGPIKVLFFERPAGAASPAKGCVEAKAGVLKKIAKKPKSWYVNVHTPEFPDGAIRGQLTKGGAGGSSSGGGGGGGGGGGLPY